MKTPKNISASVKARLQTLARERNEEFNLLFMRYGIERLLYRLSKSAYADKFLLKGAMLFSLWETIPHRPTRDLDLLGFCPSEEDTIISIFKEVLGVKVLDDGIIFDPMSITAEEIKGEDNYGGIRISFSGRLGKSVMPIKIDIGTGDAVTPTPEFSDFPTLLDFPAPHIRAYPIYTVVAEKVEAAVKLLQSNSRMKDLYDLWYISRHFDLEGQLLDSAIESTFKRRQTALPKGYNSFLCGFEDDPMKLTQWNGFLRRNRLNLDSMTFEDVVIQIRKFIDPLLFTTFEGKNWNKDQGWV